MVKRTRGRREWEFFVIIFASDINVKDVPSQIAVWCVRRVPCNRNIMPVFVSSLQVDWRRSRSFFSACIVWVSKALCCVCGGGGSEVCRQNIPENRKREQDFFGAKCYIFLFFQHAYTPDWPVVTAARDASPRSIVLL